MDEPAPHLVTPAPESRPVTPSLTLLYPIITPKSYRQPEKERDRSSKIEKTEKYEIAGMAGTNREIKERKKKHCVKKIFVLIVENVIY